MQRIDGHGPYPETEVQPPGAVLREIGGAGRDFAHHLGTGTGGERHDRAHAVSLRTSALQLDVDPMAGVPAIVAKQLWRRPIVREQHVEIAVAVEVEGE